MYVGLLFLLPRFNLVPALHQEVDVVQAVHQAMLLVGIDFKRFALARRPVGDGLRGKVDHDFRLRVGIDAVEQLLQEGFAH